MVLRQWLLILGLAAGALHPAPSRAAAGPTVATDNVKSRLVSESQSIAPGQTIWVALQLDIREGWHTYWRNPGDSGQATQIKWKLPQGFSAGPIRWTTPHRFEVPPLVNYGYDRRAMHLVPITAARDVTVGKPVTLSAHATWLVCSDVCIPEEATLQLPLPVSGGPGVIDAGSASLFDAARADMPQRAPAAARAAVTDGRLVITLGSDWGGTLSQIKSLAFFPYDEGSIDYGAPQTLKRTRDALELSMKVGYQPPQADEVRGVLLATEESGGNTLDVPIELNARLAGSGARTSGAAPVANGSTRVTAAPLAGSGTTPATQPPADGSLPSLILLAVLGGLILNLMPCVFPVLSIKAIGLVEQAKKHPAAVRTKSLVFAAGVIASMLCLAGALLALRAGGEQIGWGFQLQSPLFVTLMIYLLLGVGLNLSGVFEVGGGLAGVGDGLTQGEGHRAAFFTGVLTTLVATPCTAPFMAAAVGAALAQSTGVALSIFAALGVGLALPYVLISFAPALRRVLPRPGAWMDTLKQVFAFPMYASAAWLLWVLAQQTSSIGLGAALAGALLIALAAWAYQKSKSGGRGRAVALATAASAVALAVILPTRFADIASASAHAQSGTPARDGEAWQPYDAARLAELTAAGRPLLVNFTASWCLTCLVNERNAFADDAVESTFRRKGVTLMKGDWTNRDPAITRALAVFGRAGVPLYVVYNSKPGSREPVVLPQLLTASIVRDAFDGLPDGVAK